MKQSAIERSISIKTQESCELAQRFMADASTDIVACAEAINERLNAGGRVFIMGNGGSACDASHMAVEFMHPIIAKRSPFPAYCLSNDQTMLSAIGNDQDFSLVFSQQLQALASSNDILIGFSTSGDSANILRAFKYGKTLNALTVGILGKDGGRIKTWSDHPFIVPSYSIHRIQEVHVKLMHLLWDSIHLVRGEEDII